MSAIDLQLLQADWYATLLKRALLEASSVEEAAEAAEVALSLQPYRVGSVELALEIDAMLARGPTREVGEVWQGPSKRWFTKNKAGRVVPYKPPSGTHEEHVWRGKKKEQVQQAAGGAVEKIKALAAVKDLSQAPAREVAATVKDLAQDLKKMTVEQLNALKKELGLKASGPKAELAQKLAQRALAKVRGTEKPVETPTPEVEKPVTPPVEPEPTPSPEPQPAPEPEPTPEPQPAPAKQNMPAPPQPGFTGEDTLGRAWENGVLVGDIAPTPHLSPDSVPARIRAATDLHAVVAQISNLGSDLPDVDSEEEKTKREKIRNSLIDVTQKVNEMMRVGRTKARGNKKAAEELELLHSQGEALKNQYKEEVARRDAVRTEREKIPDKVAEILRSMVKEPEQIFVKLDSGLPDEAKNEFNRGLSWLQGTLQKDAGGERIPLYYVKPAVAGERSFYYSTDNSITFGSSKADNRPTAVHELLHGVEENNTSIARAVKEFYRHRTAGQPLQKMNDLFPPPAGGKPFYDENEVSRPDKFALAMGNPGSGAYAGKDYGGSKGSEILTMGVQKLLEDPAGFARRDPEYCTFVIGILNGSLRSAAP